MSSRARAPMIEKKAARRALEWLLVVGSTAWANIRNNLLSTLDQLHIACPYAISNSINAGSSVSAPGVQTRNKRSGSRALAVTEETPNSY